MVKKNLVDYLLIFISKKILNIKNNDKTDIFLTFILIYKINLNKKNINII